MAWALIHIHVIATLLCPNTADSMLEHQGTDLLRVSGMIVLNGYAELKLHLYLQTHEELSWHPNKTADKTEYS